VITKANIKTTLASAAEVLRDSEPEYQESAIALVNFLVNDIKKQDDHLELLAFLCFRLMDCKDYVVSLEHQNLFKNIALQVQSRHTPAINDYIKVYQEYSNELLDLLTKIPAPSLKERVRIARITPEDQYIDPITRGVMECPVTYTVNEVEYTIDLNTLLNAQAGVFGLKCPFTRDYILLKDLQPRPEYVDAILKLCEQAPKPKSEQDAIQKACILARRGDVDGLEKWLESNPYVNCSTVFKDPANKLCTPLHMACATNNYDAAIWLLKHGALPNVKNAAQKIPIDYLNLEKLQSEITSNPQSDGLRFLLALYSIYVEKSDMEYNRNMLGVVKSNYAPALYWHGMYLCKKYWSSEDLNRGLQLMVEAAKQDFYLAADSVISTLSPCFNSNAEFVFSFLGADAPSKIASYLTVASAILPSDAPVANRGELERFYANIMLNSHSLMICNKFQVMHAYGIAHLSYTREPNEEKLELLNKLCEVLSPEDAVTQRKKVRNLMA
jgi:hypothetical protein